MWESLANPPALGAGDRRFESGHPDCLTRRFRWSSCWYERPAVNRGDAGSIPAAGARTIRKGKPIGDGTRLETGRAMSLEGSTPSPSACSPAGLVQWHDSWLPTRRPGFDSPIPHSTRWLMRPWPSGQARASQVRQAGSTPAGRSRESANGRLPDFESGGGGSNPPSRTPGQLLLVVTPRSERGGRWFDSSPRNSVQALTEAIRPDEGPVLKTGGGLGPLVGSSPTASASKGPGTPTAERPGLNPGACGFDSHPGYWVMDASVSGSVGNGQTTLA